MLRNYTKDPGIWLQLAVNVWIIYYYTQHPDSIHTIIALFWMQSVFIGLFNALNIFTLSNTVPDSFTINNQPGNRQGCAGFFFLVHYGFFHLVYVFFLIPSVIDLGKLDWEFLRITFWLLIIAGTMEFVRDKIRNRSHAVNISNMFFLPYLRIIPMHLLILLPSFLHLSSYTFFLLLKTVTDLLMYILYKRMIFKPIHNQ